jgi:hypothetical protein
MESNAAINDYLEDAKERAVAAHSKGNKLGGMYLAMIAGMWNHTARRQPNPTPFENENNDLYLAFLWGNDASADAMRSNEREMAIRKKIEERKMKMAKNKNKPLKNPYTTPSEGVKKESIWNKKLW